MSDIPNLTGQKKENWGSKLGVVLAVAGSAVGLGNFLRFPGQAVNNGGGAFMIPYLISFFMLGIPIAWCEWTMGRMGGRYGQNSAPGIMYSLWRNPASKFVGAITLVIPVVVYMYYVLLEALCLNYCISFAMGDITEAFSTAISTAGSEASEVGVIVETTGKDFGSRMGLGAHGALFSNSNSLLILVPVCFVVNFIIIYQGVTRGIEKFCKWAMPLLIMSALVILFRVLTLPKYY